MGSYGQVPSEGDRFEEHGEIWFVRPTLALNESQARAAVRSAEFLLAVVAFATSISATDMLKAPAFNFFFVLVALLAFIIDLCFGIAFCYSDPMSSEEAPSQSNVVMVSLLDVVVTSIWAVLWFLASIVYLANTYTVTEDINYNVFKTAGAFGLFSVIAWTTSAVLGWRQYQNNRASLHTLSAN